eukprot:g82.t1
MPKGGGGGGGKGRTHYTGKQKREYLKRKRRLKQQRESGRKKENSEDVITGTMPSSHSHTATGGNASALEAIFGPTSSSAKNRLSSSLFRAFFRRSSEEKKEAASRGQKGLSKYAASLLVVSSRKKENKVVGGGSEGTTEEWRGLDSIHDHCANALPWFDRPKRGSRDGTRMWKPEELDAFESAAFRRYLSTIRPRPSVATVATTAPVAEVTAASFFRPFVPFETNLEVWRQIWRTFDRDGRIGGGRGGASLSRNDSANVVENAGKEEEETAGTTFTHRFVPVIVADIRCPLLYLPTPFLDALNRAANQPASSSSSSSAPPQARVVVVLTKIDLVSERFANAWKRYILDNFGHLVRDVVLFTTTRPDVSSPFHCETRIGQRRRLLRDQRVRYKTRRTTKGRGGGSKKKKKKKVLTADREEEEGGGEGGDDRRLAPRAFTAAGALARSLGAGKSSLMNALVGDKITSVSATPGHTKHIQSWNLSDAFRSALRLNERENEAAAGQGETTDDPISVELVDTPGLVIPRSRDTLRFKSAALRPNEDARESCRVLYELFGIAPLAQIQQPFDAVRFLAERFPIPLRYGFKFPEEDEDEYWTSPHALCEAFACKKKWMLSKSKGRFDVHRAALEIVRDCANGVLLVCFEPPSRGAGVVDPASATPEICDARVAPAEADESNFWARAGIDEKEAPRE